MAMVDKARAAKLSRLAAMLVDDAETATTMADVGFDLDNEDDQMMAAVVYDAVRELLGLPEPAGLLPVRKAVHAGRNDPCPCGSGRKYKKCCLSKAPSGGSQTGPSLPRIPAEMFPRMMDEDGLAEHLDQLPGLFEEVAELGDVSFDASACAEHARANRATFKRKEKKDEWEAHRWMAEEYLADHDESVAFAICADAAKAAAPRYRGRPEVFRTLVAVVLVADSLVRADDVAHTDPGLGTFLFWWTLENAVDGMAALGDLLAEVGGDSKAGALEMLRDRHAIEELAQRIESASPKGWRLLEKMAGKELDRIADALAGRDFPVGLPAVCFAPWYLRLVQFVPPATEPARIAQELERRKSEILEMTREESDKLVATAGLEDMRLAAEILGEWLASKVNRKHKQRKLVELVQGHCLLGTSFPFWSDWLAGAFVKARPSFASWEAEAVRAWLERATPEALEKHGDLLAEHGYPELARRIWECCARLGPIPDSVRGKLARGKP